MTQQEFYNALCGQQQAQSGGFWNQLGGMAQAQSPYDRGFALAQDLRQAIKQPVKEKTLFQEITTDVKSFIKEHRGIIYFVAVALIVDHFVFKGAFKARLQGMAEKLVAKVETQIAK